MITNKDLDRKLELLLRRQALIGTIVSTLIASNKTRKEFIDTFNKTEDTVMEER